MALVATIVARALMAWNSPVRLLMPIAPVMRPEPPPDQTGDEQPVDQLHALGLERAAQRPGERRCPPPSGCITRARSSPRVGRRLYWPSSSRAKFMPIASKSFSRA